VKRALSLVVALGLTTLVSSVALAGAECAYHQTQAAVTQTDAAKTVATAPADNAGNTVRTAQADQQVKSAPVKK
jgi:hypothetical protein